MTKISFKGMVCGMGAFLTSIVANAGSLEWGVTSLRDYYEYAGGLYFTIEPPRLSVDGSWSGLTLVLKALEEGSQLYASTCMMVEKGTLITKSLVAAGDVNGFFYKSEAIYGTAFSDYDLLMRPGDTIYVGYLTYQTDTAYHSSSDTTTHIGWFELYLNDDGELQMPMSARGVDGDALYAGSRPGFATPEPTTALLLLLGAGALCLRRRSPAA